MNLPQDFVTKFEQLLGPKHAAELFASLATTPKKAFRLNPLKPNYQQVSYSLESPVTAIPDAYYGSINGNEVEQLAGFVYSQDPSAMFVVTASQIKPGDVVLDLCAAPGGKSTQIASQLAQEGLLVSNEINAKRAKILLENIERWGISNAVVTNETPARLSTKFPEFFDKIVVDAPCSGEGMFRKDHEAMQYWSNELVAKCAVRQREIVDEAYKMLAPGGQLTYSTCTFSPEEDEQIVEYLLEQYADLELVPIAPQPFFDAGHPEWTQSQNPALAHTARFWTSNDFGEGQFVAILRKAGAAGEPKLTAAKTNLTKNEVKLVTNFLTDNKIQIPLTNWQNSNNHLFLPALDPKLTKGLRILRNGLEIGELKNKRIALHQQLAETLAPTQAQVYELTTAMDFAKFRHGETLPVTTPLRGFVLVSYQDKIFSWGKIGQDQILKNFYPKGLRK